MGNIFGLALPIALVWMLLTSRFNWQGFILGYALGLIILFFFRPARIPIRWRRVPGQLWALLIYGLTLYRDILLSGLDIARRVLSKDMRLSPGVVALEMQDPDKNALVAALSADAISLTPGELVIEIEENTVLYVHTLNLERTSKYMTADQAKRLRLLNRILGRESI
jgi:multicomponent Na+:H+ antiporter subunit E